MLNSSETTQAMSGSHMHQTLDTESATVECHGKKTQI